MALWLGASWSLRAAGTNDWLPELPVWGHSIELFGGGGYRDNLLLDESNRESSHYFSGASDVTIWRLPVDRHQFFFLMSGEYFRYPEGKELDDEAYAAAIAQYKNLLAPSLEFAGVAQYSYTDQVLGVLTETNFNPIPVVAHITGWRPSLRRHLTPRWWLELEGYGSRQYFKSPLDDLWEAGVRLHAGHDYGHRSSLQWTYKFTYRLYDFQPALQANGTVLDHVLRVAQHDGEMAWNHHWDSERKWRSSTRAGLQLARDNASGFFDYNRYLIRQQLRYRASPWEVEGQARLSFYDFLVQRTRSETGPETEKTLLSFQCRISREIMENLGIYLLYEYAQSLSNREGDDYDSNKVGAGVDWEF